MRVEATGREAAVAISGVVLVGVIAFARFAPGALRIDRDAHQHDGRVALALLALALLIAAVRAARQGVRPALPALALLLAAVPGISGHTKWVLGLAALDVVVLAALSLVPQLQGLDRDARVRVQRAAAAGVLFLCAWGLLHHLWYGRHQIVDTPIYQGWGDRIAAGQMPYRDFSLEYPPGAIPVFVAPELTAAPADFGAYGRAFEKWMALCGVAIVLLVGAALAPLRAPPRRSALALGLVAIFPLLLGNVVLSRFDLWPAALTAGALAALLAGRESLASAVLAAAVLAKLYPAVIVPIALAYVWRRSGRDAAMRFAGVLVALLVAGFLPFAIISPGGLAHSFSTQLGRPLQLESLGSALLIAAHHVGGLALTLKSDHGSQNLEGTLPSIVGALSGALQLCAVVWTWIAFARGAATRERLVTASAAAVVAFVAFGKVFSPQYMVWLVPLVALTALRSAWLTLAAALVATQLWFPSRYWQLALGFHPFESWALLSRDLFVAALFALLAVSLQDERLREARPVREPLEPVRREVQV